MGNIVLIRLVIFVYSVLCAVFLLTPYLGGGGKRFGVRVNKYSKTVRGISVFYTVAAFFVGVIFALLSISKNSIIFTDITVALYIFFMSAIYLNIRSRLKKMFQQNIFREIILNNPPKEYILKGINPLFYFFYLFPVAVSFFLGRNNAYVLWVSGIQLVIPVLAYLLNLIICRFTNFVDDDVEKSVKKNVKYRRMWNINGYFILLAISMTITVMYMEYIGFLNLGVLGSWLPFVIMSISVLIMVIFSVRYLKK